MPEQIIETNVKEQYELDAKKYAIYVSRERVTADFRDGLKPVQRRCVFGPYKQGYTSPNKKKKSADIVGNVMAKYHAHGDCLGGSTPIFGNDGNVYTIEELYRNGVPSLEVLAIDQNGNVVPAVAHSFRIGQYTNKIYHIRLSNGYVLQCTSNHPIAIDGKGWVKAEDIRPMDIPIGSIIRNIENRPFINTIPLYRLIYEYTFGPIPDGYVIHHRNENPWNNALYNLQPLTRADHALIHGDYNTGLNKGRETMYQKDGRCKEKIKAINNRKMTLFNKEQGIRKFNYAIRLLTERGLALTENNYELLRGEVYNLPKVDRLIKKGYGESFDGLVYYVQNELKSLSEMYAENPMICPVTFIDNTPKEFKDNKPRLVAPVAALMHNTIMRHSALTYELYCATSTQGTTLTEDAFYQFMEIYKQDFPYVESIYIEEVNNVPMYDFTVDGYENMLIPTFRNEYGDISLICVHNSSIYGTMVGLANWYKIKIPLLYPEGNWGSVMGDGPAAMRYTECSLNQFAMDCVLADLDRNPNTVDWTPNYDESTVEPVFLAPAVPLLLINGTMGIGVGLKTDIPRHNLVEVIDATLNLIKNPNAPVVLIPDLCMPCEIINTNWKSICNNGFGNYKVRAAIDEITYKGYPALVIKSLPDYTTLDTITEKIEDMIQKKMILQIKDTFDLSDNNHIEFVIQLKQGSDVGYVRDMLYKNTGLEASCRVNFEVLDGLRLMRMSYKSYLLNFIEFRKLTKFRLHCNEVQEYKTRFHHIDAFIKVIESGQIDFIYNSIKKRKDTNDAELIEFLIKKVGLTDLQAAFIINSDLKKFSIGYLNKYKQEAADLTMKIDDLMRKILDDRFIEEEIVQELTEIKAKYGSPRICKVIDVAEANSIPQGTFVFIITNNNFIKKIPVADNLSAYRDDGIRCIGTFNNTDSLLLFDERGKVMKVDAHKIPLTAKNNAGTDLRLMNKAIGANIIYMTSKEVLEPLKDQYPKNFITMVTRNGNCKKIDLEDCIAAPPSGIFYIKVDPDDAVKQILVLNETDHLMVYSDKKAIKFGVSTMPYLKRGTKGSRAMANATLIDGMSQIGLQDEVLVVTESGKVNKINSVVVPLNERGGNGSNVIKLGKTDKIKAIVSAGPNDILRLRTIENTAIDIPVKDIQAGSSVSAGTKYTNSKDQVINVQVIKS